MRGGHARGGPIARSAAEQTRRGAKVRPRNRRPPAGKVTPSIVQPPADLTPAALVHWQYYEPLLSGTGLLTYEGRDALASYCEVLVHRARLEQQLRAPDYRDVVETSRGLRANPLLQQWRQVCALQRLLESDLMLSPAVRVRLPDDRRLPGPPPPKAGSAGKDDEDEGWDFYGDGSAH